MRSILNPWPWKMAWRDSRSSRGQLLLFAASIVLGVAALVAISGFRANLKSALDLQAKSLLGADLLLSGRQPLTGGAKSLVEGLGGIQAREVRFSSARRLFPSTARWKWNRPRRPPGSIRAPLHWSKRA